MRKESDLHEYQTYATSYIQRLTHCALFLDMGLGKTVITLTAINRLMFEELEISKALVVAPKRVAEKVWPDEVDEWEHLEHLEVSIVSGTQRQRQAALAREADIYTISRDNIAWLCGLYGGSSLPFDMIVIDELSSFKSPKSVRFKALRQVQASFSRVVGLTGAPSPNGLIDLWSQLWLLDRGERLGRTLTEYRNTYFVPGMRNGAIVYNYKLVKNSEKKIYKQISDICLSMKAGDYLDLQPPEHNPVKLDMPDKLRDKYLEFEKEQVLRLFADTDEITAVNAAALSNKLLQFANGAVYGEDLRPIGGERKIHDIHNIKIDAAEELVESANGRPVIIGWAYRHDLYKLRERLKKYKPRELKTSGDIDDWNAGKIRVLLMHPASGGHGLNLQYGGDILIWFGQTWSLELYQQLNKRLDRQGQENTVTIHSLIMSGTIDEDVVKAIQNKTNKQDGLMKAVKARINKYV